MTSIKKMVSSMALVPVPVKAKQARNIVAVIAPKRKRNRKTKVPRSLGSGLSLDYMRCLADPFNNPPVRAGFGCLVPSGVHSAYLRGSFATNADGSFSLFSLPNYFQLLLLSKNAFASAPTVATCDLQKSANSIILNNLCNSSRPLAMGLKLIPMVAATAVPGVVSLGCAPRSTLGDVTDNLGIAAGSGLGLFNQPTSVVSQLPYLREHMGRPSGMDYFQVTWRPTDVKDFEFTDEDVATISLNNPGGNVPFAQASGQLGSAQDTQGSFLVATGQGFGSSVTIYFEIVFHFESIASNRTVANLDNDNVQPSLADTGSHSSFESLYRSIQGLLPSVDQVAGVATSVLSSPMIRTAARRYVERNLLGVRASGYELLP